MVKGRWVALGDLHRIVCRGRVTEAEVLACALKHMKNKEVVKNCCVTSRSAAEVESAFGCTEYKLFSGMLKLVNQK